MPFFMVSCFKHQAAAIVQIYAEWQIVGACKGSQVWMRIAWGQNSFFYFIRRRLSFLVIIGFSKKRRFLPKCAMALPRVLLWAILVSSVPSSTRNKYSPTSFSLCQGGARGEREEYPIRNQCHHLLDKYARVSSNNGLTVFCCETRQTKTLIDRTSPFPSPTLMKYVPTILALFSIVEIACTKIPWNNGGRCWNKNECGAGDNKKRRRGEGHGNVCKHIILDSSQDNLYRRSVLFWILYRSGNLIPRAKSSSPPFLSRTLPTRCRPTTGDPPQTEAQMTRSHLVRTPILRGRRHKESKRSPTPT